MRGELQALLTTLDLSIDDLLFQDEVLDRCATTGDALELFLVDHNELSATWKLSHPQVPTKVHAIIDHHADAQQFLDASPRIVEVCGSNASLLIEYLRGFRHDAELQARLAEVEKHLLLAVIMDTVNFTWRVTPKDVCIAGSILEGRKDMAEAELHALCKPQMNAFDSGVIPETKFPLTDVLYKDYKLYEHGDGFFYAISTIKTSFETFIQHEFNGSIDDMVKAVFGFMKQLGLALFAITLAVREPGSSTFYQQLGIFSDQINVTCLKDHVQASGAQLELISEGPNFYLGMQNNPNVSRKQLQPYFQKHLNNTL